MSYVTCWGLEMTEYMYCFIRKDLLTVHQIIQLAHCAFEAGYKWKGDSIDHPHICLLEVSDLGELRKIYKYLRDENVDFEMFFEPDTKNGNDRFPIGWASIITRPISDLETRDKFKQFKMYE